MLLNSYYYAPHNHSLLGSHLRADLEHMRELGANAVSLCVQEDQLWNWHSRRLHNVVELARSLGLQVYAVPNRWCGLVAGWLDGHSNWTLEHPYSFLSGEMEIAVSDPLLPEVRHHFEKSLRILVQDYAFDGVIWDEPRSAAPEIVTFLDEMSAYAKSLRPGLVLSMFAESGRLETAPHYAATRHIDYLGSDGHVRDDSHQMHRMKNTIFRAHAAFHPVLTAAGKKTMYLLEAQRHRDEDLEAYLAVLDRAFALPMDQLMFYYSAHEMSLANEDRFNAATWAAVQKVARARLS
jgi:hypothetical protein